MSKVLIDIYKNILKDGTDCLVIVDDLDNLWFLADHVCDMLGYDNTKQAVKQNVKEDDIATYEDLKQFVDDDVKIKNSTIYVSEPGLYKLIISSKTKNAEKFRRWLFENVLSSIRKTDNYESNEDEKEQLDKLNEKIYDKFKSNKTKPLFKTEKQLRKKVDSTKKELNDKIDEWNKLVKNGSVFVSIKLVDDEELNFELKAGSSDNFIKCFQEKLQPYIDYDRHCKEFGKCNGNIGKHETIIFYYCTVNELNKIIPKCIKSIDDDYVRTFTNFVKFASKMNKKIEVEIKIFARQNKQKGGYSYKTDIYKYKYLKYQSKYLNLLQYINNSN